MRANETPGLSRERDSPSQRLSLVRLFELAVSARKSLPGSASEFQDGPESYDILRRALVEDLARSDAILKGDSKPMRPASEESGTGREAEGGGTRLLCMGSWSGEDRSP